MTNKNTRIDNVNEPAVTKKITRRRGNNSGDKISPKLYFNANTQAAICAYQRADKNDNTERNKQWNSEIMPAFEKLVENLINIHKFSGMHDSYEVLKSDCVNFLFETLYKFDPTRGTNAFSYFNVVAKNWLIIRTKQKAQRIKRSVSLDDPDALSSHEYKIVEDNCIVQPPDVAVEQSNDAQNIVGVLYEIRSRMKSENELACINSIITIFENIENIDLLNKSAILLYMRELSGLTPKQLTTTLQTVKRHYKRLKSDNKCKFF